ncbi:MAG TPA: sulfatase-like hydrolase/transferase [Thermoanaerobaculia bacterium]|nr:sulfatase-like hydrolase/transferase [Thermoanaerobaculia bacterium]
MPRRAQRATLAAAAARGGLRRRRPGFSRRRRAVLAGCALAAVVLAAFLLVRAPMPRSASSGSPAAASGAFAAGADLLLVTIDTLRADSLGFAGNRTVATPTLDRLAAAGRVFTDAHAHCVVTLPSHTNILTGLYPYQHEVRDNSGFVLSPRIPTLATVLSQAGYATAAFVGAFPLDSRFGLNRGFDLYDDRFVRGARPAEFGMDRRPGDQVIGPARRWWEAHRGRRRFLWVHLYDPHAPYSAPEPFASRFAGHPYLGAVSATDAYLAPLLLPFLEGREPRALIAVTADHGEALGEHGELTHGLFAYEATLKVPLLLWGAGISPGRDDRAARHIDLAPTLLGAVGVAAPPGLPGASLLASWTGPADCYFESLTPNLTRGWAPLTGILAARQKLIDLPVPELYDLARDPGESNNLWHSERRRAAELARRLPRGALAPVARDATPAPEVQAKLRSLGYAVGAAPAKSVYTPADDPKNLIGIDRALQAIVQAYEGGDFARAAGLSMEVREKQPQLAEASQHLALALSQLERPAEAVAVLQSARSRGLGGEALLRQLALALAEAGRPAEAVALLQPLAAGGDAATLNALGVALSDSGRHAEAIALLERALAREPMRAETYEHLGIAELARGRPAAARAQLRRALALDERLPISWNTLGVALYKVEGPGPAVAAWERAAAIDPRQYDALYNIGLVGAETGRRGEARRALDRFIATAPAGRFRAEIARARALLARLPAESSDVRRSPGAGAGQGSSIEQGAPPT